MTSDFSENSLAVRQFDATQAFLKEVVQDIFGIPSPLDAQIDRSIEHTHDPRS